MRQTFQFIHMHPAAYLEDGTFCATAQLGNLGACRRR